MPDSGGEEATNKGKWKVKVDDLEHQDPLLVFGSEILTIILAKLDLRSLAEARLVSRGWKPVASSDRIWGFKCQELWLDKAHIPRVSTVEGLPKMIATLLSIRDGKRTRITRDDLCDHVWEFRFTEMAPEYWRELDPSWRGEGAPPMRRYFHPDGSITADPEDKVWGGHESSYTIVTGLLADGQVREHYVRINRWPKMMAKRHPDWSWELRNRLYFYRSIRERHGPASTSLSFSGGSL
ncbi:uncharacterized protein LOC121796018 isoform X1 [Salvia splendens]|uniref:uncharacterized protein LOC121796018 isoform X1 n=1 Tax=Salvia splendens TaxID=180675 RepID=UPI001C27AFFC|nr:uncharacterized protein LOC121796018 isoform X1 [Salvia splendens]